MKRDLLLCAVISALSVLMSCSDNEETRTDYTMEIYGQSYPMTSGAIWQSSTYYVADKVEYIFRDTYENSDGVMVTDEVKGYTMSDKTVVAGNFILSLYGDGLTYSPDVNETKGKGACISFHLASESTTEVTEGTYHYATTKAPGTFTAYSSALYDMSSNSQVAAEITEGEITIRKEGDGYSVSYSCKTSFGATISGNYAGKFSNTKIVKASIAHYKDVNLYGLQDPITLGDYVDGVPVPQLGLNNVSPALFASASGAVKKNSTYVVRNDVDLALFHDKEEEALLFCSPITVRRYSGHNNDYNIPIHTEYMFAPSSFTDEDFENLTADDLNFEITDSPVRFDLNSFSPKYVFFRSGTGVMGVIKVKSILKPTQITVSGRPPMFGLIAYLLSGFEMDVKSKADFRDADIR